ncbi:FtsQ-type POTRA domain-containing protein [bacterium]|nr:FtsQ-type POTRA domain-containing protein [bacterium]
MKKWRALIIASCLLVAIVAMSMFAIYRWALGLQTVAIQGNYYVTQDEVRNAVELYHGRNAVLLSVGGALNRRVAAMLPKVQRVRSDYKWPHAVQLTVIEKKPWIVLAADEGAVIVAADGTVLQRRSPEDVAPLPREAIVVRSVDPVYFSQKIINPYLLNALTPVVSVIRSYFPDQVLQMELKGLVMSPAGCSFDELILIKDDSVPVYVGAEAKMGTKLSALRQFLWYVGMDTPADETEAPIRYIDLRVDGKVLVGYGA